MPSIDASTFNELKQISGEEFINELIDAFLEEAPTMIHQMQSAITAHDVETFRRNAHSLKSNANTFGATELGTLARELEIMAKGKNFDVGNRLEKLEQAFGSVANELKSLRV